MMALLHLVALNTPPPPLFNGLLPKSVKTSRKEGNCAAARGTVVVRGPTPGLTSTNLTHKDIHGDTGASLIFSSLQLRRKVNNHYLNLHTCLVVMMALIIMSYINDTDM